MDEQKQPVPGAPKTNDSQSPSQHHNWITDLYDRMNISVRTLDITLVVLMVFILAVIVIASQK